MSTTTTPKKRPTVEEDKERADKLLAAYAELKQELAEKASEYKADVKAITESIEAAEEELIRIGNRRKKKFINNRYELTDGYLLMSEETKVKSLKDFSWSKFIRLFPDFAKTEFKVGNLKQAFADLKLRPRLVKSGRVDLFQEKAIKVKLNKVDDEVAAN